MSEIRATVEHRPIGSTRAWLGVLVPPLAWGAQLYTSWVFAEVIACAPANQTFGTVMGLRVSVFTGIVNGVLLGLSVLAGLAAYSELRERRGREDPTPATRATELARAGVISSILFSILIAASYVVVASLSCR